MYHSILFDLFVKIAQQHSTLVQVNFLFAFDQSGTKSLFNLIKPSNFLNFFFQVDVKAETHKKVLYLNTTRTELINAHN